MTALVESDEEFENWIRQLDEDVIQADYGYEQGEFAVFPDHWRKLFEDGLTPQQAFRRALDAFAEARRERDACRKENWERIQREDAVLRESTRPVRRKK